MLYQKDIPEEALNSIFGAFIQSSKAKTGAGVTDVELAIRKETIENHNEKTWTKSNPEGRLYSNLLFRQTCPTLRLNKSSKKSTLNKFNRIKIFN